MRSALLYITSPDVPIGSQIYVGQASLPHLPDKIYLWFLLARAAGSPCISLPLPPFSLGNTGALFPWEALLKVRFGCAYSRGAFLRGVKRTRPVPLVEAPKGIVGAQVGFSRQNWFRIRSFSWVLGSRLP